MSQIWKYFEAIQGTDKKDKRGRCLDDKCRGPVQTLKCTGGNTKSLIGHLKSYHQEKYKEFNLLTAQSKESTKSLKRKHDDTSTPSMKQPKLMDISAK